MFAIYKRELRSYFTTAVGYVFLAIIVALSAVAFSLTTILQASNDVTTYFTVLLFILSELDHQLFGSFSGTFWYYLVMFVVMALAMTLLEYIVGVVSFKGFHLRLWDYSKLWGNIQGIICPLFTFFWGVWSLAYYFLLYPRLRKLVEWFVAHPLASFMVGVCFGIFLIDLCFSIHLGAVVQKKAAEIDKNVYDAIDVQKLWHKMQSRGGFFRLVSIRPLTERIDAFDEFLHRRPGSMGKEK